MPVAQVKELLDAANAVGYSQGRNEAISRGMLNSALIFLFPYLNVALVPGWDDR